MAKLAPTSIKYIIRAKIKASGIIEKPDVIGAVFGQTEGLLGSELDLRELQQTGRIGRIDVTIKSAEGVSEGEIIIPSSLDASETALIAATLETIERVGPCTAEIKLVAVEDTRSDKRKYVVDKAKDILKGLMDAGEGTNLSEVSEQIKESVREGEITNLNGLAAGPDAAASDEIILVEGRADVINLLKFGIRNAVAVGGTLIAKGIPELTKEKIVTVFVDGDRGGQLIVKELMQVAELDYVAVAPEGKEVEELSKKEVHKALRDKLTIDQYTKKSSGPAQSGPPRREFRDSRDGDRREFDRGQGFSRPPHRGFRDSRDRGGPPREGRFERRPEGFDRGERPFDRAAGPSEDRSFRRARLRPGEKQAFKTILDELVGTRAACILNEKDEVMGRVPVAELESVLATIEKPHAVVFDGKVDAKLSFAARKKGVKFLIGMEKEQVESSVGIFDRKDLDKV